MNIQYIIRRFDALLLIGSFLVMAINTIWIHFLPLGISSFCLWIILTQRYIRRRDQENGHTIIHILAVFFSPLLLSLFAVYFFKLPDWLVVLFFGLSNVMVLTVWRHKPIITGVRVNEQKTRSPKVIYGLLGSWTLICCIIILSYYRISTFGHHYQGQIAGVLPDYILGMLIFVLWYLLIKLKSNTKWILILTVTATLLQSIYIFSQDSLFGADSWRHAAIIKQINLGQPYQPTKFVDLIKINTEKVPNALFYTSVSSISRLTQIDSITLQRYFFILFLGPLAVFVLFHAANDITKNTTVARVISLAALMVPGYFAVEGSVNPRSIGIFFLLISAWVWLRYLRDRKMRWEIFVFTSLALLAYPTTGYYSIALAGLCFIVPWIATWKYKLPTEIFILPTVALLPLPILLLDIYQAHASIGAMYANNPSNITAIFTSWVSSTISFTQPWSVVVYGFTIASLLILYRRQRNTGFIIAVTIFFSLLFNTLANSIFTESYVPFSSRTPAIYAVIRTLLFGGASGYLLLLYLKNKQSKHILTLGIIVSVLVMQNGSIQKINFGWSPSNNEIQAVKMINTDAEGVSYSVLADETTSAVGYTLAKTPTSYYWYPNTPLAHLADQFVRNPSNEILKQTCILSNINRVYFIDNDIPPTGSFRKINNSDYNRLFKKTATYGNVVVYQQSCSQIESATKNTNTNRSTGEN